MKRWLSKITERRVVQGLALAHMAALWGYGLTHWLPGTLIVSTLFLMFVLHGWTEEGS